MNDCGFAIEYSDIMMFQYLEHLIIVTSLLYLNLCPVPIIPSSLSQSLSTSNMAVVVSASAITRRRKMLLMWTKLFCYHDNSLSNT